VAKAARKDPQNRNGEAPGREAADGLPSAFPLRLPQKPPRPTRRRLAAGQTRADGPVLPNETTPRSGAAEAPASGDRAALSADDALLGPRASAMDADPISGDRADPPADEVPPGARASAVDADPISGDRAALSADEALLGPRASAMDADPISGDRAGPPADVVPPGARASAANADLASGDRGAPSTDEALPGAWASAANADLASGDRGAPSTDEALPGARASAADADPISGDRAGPPADEVPPGARASAANADLADREAPAAGREVDPVATSGPSSTAAAPAAASAAGVSIGPGAASGHGTNPAPASGAGWYREAMRRNRPTAFPGWPARGFGVTARGPVEVPAGNRPVIKVSLEMAATAGGVRATPARPAPPAPRSAPPPAAAPAASRSRGPAAGAASSKTTARAPADGSIAAATSAASPAPTPRIPAEPTSAATASSPRAAENVSSAATATAASSAAAPVAATTASPVPPPAAASAAPTPAAAPSPGAPGVASAPVPAGPRAAPSRRVRAVSIAPRIRAEDDEPLAPRTGSRNRKPAPEVEPLPPLRLPDPGARIFTVEDLAAPACAARIEAAVARIPGVAGAEASAGTGLLAVHPATVDEAAVREAIAHAGHRLAGATDAAAVRRPLVAAGLVALAGAVAHLLGSVVPALAVAVAAGSLAAAWPVIGPALRHGLRGRLAPEILPVASALVVLVAAVAGAGLSPAVAAAPLAAHLLGLAAAAALRARARAAVDRLAAAVPPGPGPKVGERVDLAPGATVPADARLLATVPVDETPLGGDATERVAGETLAAGSVVPEGAPVQIVAPAARSLAVRALAVVHRAAATDADGGPAGTLSRYFPPAVLAVALLAGVLAGPGAAAAVLGAAAPLALAAAVPLALAAGLGRAVSAGAAPRSMEALLRAGRVRHAVLDTGSALSRGAARVTDFVARGGHDDLAVLRLAAAAGAGLDLPGTRALVHHARDIGLSLPGASGVSSTPGAGFRARVEGHDVAVGTGPFLATSGLEAGPLAQLATELAGRGRTALLVAVDGAVVAVAGIADSPRPSSRRALGRLEIRDVDILLAGGDAAPAVKWLARAVGLAASAGKGDLSAEGKRELVNRLRKTGVTALASGSAADAPALAAADLGVSVNGSPEAEAAAGALLILPDPSALAGLVEAGQATRTAALAAGGLAIAGCVAGPGLAAAGVVGPMGAAVCAFATTVLALGTAALPGLRFGPGRPRDPAAEPVSLAVE
jgi:Cu+-exporting ATPase